ncbi:MAG: hypothetical protein A2X86_10515 [Bdellovibrionales bacterium GWA2_49_15]|nr:MAG: hypothetical protein A2X86_10515 [Bdellovibrionales bacterium GWA2_49_15]HAZ14760.1 hypothetical protein [Bdellovibrionales bacterium]
MNETLIHIRKTIISGRPDEGRSLLAKFLKTNSLSTWDTILVSEIYRSLSELDRALKVLGPELGPSELRNAPDDQLALQFRLAYMLQNNGARFLAERMFANLTDEVHRRGKDPVLINPHYWRYLTALYLTMEDYANALTSAQKATQTLTSEQSEWWGSMINQSIALFGLHQTQACELFLTQLLEKAVSIGHHHCDLVHHRLALLYLDTCDWPKALYHCQEAERTLKNPYSLKYIYICRAIGTYYSLQGDAASAVKYLMKGLGPQTQSAIPPYTNMMNYYWLEKNLGNRLPVAQRLATRAHISFCPASYALGKCYTHEQLPLTLHFGMKYTENSHDCWVVEGDKILATRYSEVIHNYRTNKWPLMDLYSGVVYPPGSEGDTAILLTDLQVRCLSTILGSGDLGVSRWALTDFIYRQDFFHPTDGENRLKNLVQKLRKVGFEIKCENNLYSIELPKDQVILLPMDHLSRGPQAILAIQHPIFKRSDVETMFQIGSSTAKGWIKQWLEDGFIEAEGKGRNIAYIFTAKRERNSVRSQILK